MKILVGYLRSFAMISLWVLSTFAAPAGAQAGTLHQRSSASRWEETWKAGQAKNTNHALFHIYNVLYSFCSNTVYICKDGVYPQAGLVQDAAGNLYGTTTYGGSPSAVNCGFLAPGCGTVFEVDSTGREKVLYSFCHGLKCKSGALPAAGLILDAAGTLYGTTSAGGNFFGTPNSICLGSAKDPLGCGTVFKVDSTGYETVLYRFCSQSNCADGAVPYAALITDSAGNFYGTTAAGGANNGGTVFKLDATGHETVLYSFCAAANCTDGIAPYAGLITDAAGNLYGTTTSGGANNGGAVFKLDTTGHETVLYSFCSASNCTDGNDPYAGLIMDAAGNLYGTTTYGGANYANWPCIPTGCGTVFMLAPPSQPVGNWTENVLYSFCAEGDPNCPDGANPNASLIRDVAGSLYGTTEQGAATGSNGGMCGAGCGTVFKLAPQPEGTWNEHVLNAFCLEDGCPDGQYPEAGLIQDALGNLYGTASEGGYGDAGCINLNGTCGLVFALTTRIAGVTLTSLPNPSHVNQTVTLSVVVSGSVGQTPTGSVTFEAAKTPLGTVALANGKASLTTTFTSSREFSIVVSYSGDQNYQATKSKSLKQVVEK